MKLLCQKESYEFINVHHLIAYENAGTIIIWIVQVEFTNLLKKLTENSRTIITGIEKKYLQFFPNNFRMKNCNSIEKK